MSVTATSPTSADATFSAAGTSAWNAGMTWGGSDASFASGVLTIGGSTAGAGIVVTGGTITTDLPQQSITVTRNASGVTFSPAFDLVVTDTASAAASLLWRIKGGATAAQLLAITKTGVLQGDSANPTLTLSDSNGAKLAYSTNSSFVAGASAHIDIANVATLQISASLANLASAVALGWSSTGGASVAADTGLSRISAGLVGVGTGAQGSFAGSTKQATLITTAAASSAGAGTVTIGGTTQTTIGANGGASALTALPLGYLLINVAGTSAVIPYYNS